MSPATHFAASYGEARAKFVAAAEAAGASMSRHIHPTQRGFEGEELSIDLAMLGEADAPGLLLLISGTHGVEGFCGSGCQVGLLRDYEFLANVDRGGVCVLMLHALNPYGFSHLRRVNEDNADLNRNFIDFSAALPVNAAYAEIHSLVVPQTWPPPIDSERQLGAWVAAHGAAAYQAAVSGGQYRFPDGMFYGGAAPAWSNLVLRTVLREHAASRSALGWIDFHTGLGPFGHGEMIYAGGNVAADVARTKAWWGDQVTSYFDGSSTSAPLTGVNGYAAYDECPATEFAGIALEYGTCPIEQVLQALRADHWLHNHPEAPRLLRREIKRAIRDVFYIDSDDWKAVVHAQAADACRMAIGRLARAPASI
ncbi:MAG: M14 family metallopeptidase [Betaproteobacteria bacterium]